MVVHMIGDNEAPFFTENTVDKWKNSPQTVDKLIKICGYPDGFPHIPQGYPQKKRCIYVNKGGRNGL